MKVIITDDHPLMLTSLSQTLRNTGYIEVLATYTSGEDLLKGLEAHQPDIVLLDYHLPDQNGSKLARYITYHYPDIKILAITGFEKPDLAREMIESGCMGYLLKNTANEELVLQAIEQIYNGQIFMDRSIRDLHARSIRHSQQEQARPKLTQRELEILKEIASELSSQEIADKLYISKRTVDTHRNSIMLKSGAKNTVGLIKFAMELKLI